MAHRVLSCQIFDKLDVKMRFFKINFILLTFLLIDVNFTLALFGSDHLKKIKEKAKKYYKKKFGKDKTWTFLGYDITQYPGANEKYRQIHRKEWEVYYTCLKEQNDNLGEHGSAIPEAVLGFEGGTVK